MRAIIVFLCIFSFTVSNALRLKSRGIAVWDVHEEPWFNTQSNASRPEQYRTYLDAIQGMLKVRHGERHRSWNSKSDIAVFEVGCGEHYCREMIASLTSLAVQHEEGKWDVWMVVDEKCSNILDQEFQSPSSQFRKLPIQDLVLAGAGVDLLVHCTWARLWVPQVLTQYKQLFYMDSDLIVTNSIEPALRQMEEHHGVAIFMVEEVVSATCPGCGWYASNGIAVKAGANGYNAGVLGINSDVWKRSGTVDKMLDILQEAKEGKLHLSMGDQDVLNLLAQRSILYLQDFPCEFNVRFDSDCKSGSEWRAPVILHASRNMFFTLWNDAYDKLMHQANTMVYEWTDAQRLATSLWATTQIKASDLYSPCAWNRTCKR